jgi:hypothetical protein
VKPPALVVESLLSVTVNPKAFLERFRADALFSAKRSWVPGLETVQFEVTPEGRGWLHAGSLDSACSVAVPVMKVASWGLSSSPEARC